MNHEALAAEITSVERRLALIDSLIPEAEKPLHRLWEMRSQERDLLHKLNSRQRTLQAQHYADLEAEARESA